MVTAPISHTAGADQPAGRDAPDAQSAIDLRRGEGFLGWAGPVCLLVARSVTLPAAQAVLALLFWGLGTSTPWTSAGRYWMIWGTVADLVCLLGMRHFLRREGLRVRDLLGPIRLRGGRDVWLGLAIYAVVFPAFYGCSWGAQQLIMHFSGFNPALYLVSHPRLPSWAIVYGLSVWWLIWSPTEEATYQAYVMPRLSALTGRPWIAFVATTFFWALQHCMLPFFPDWRYLLYRFLAFLPVAALLFCYLRLRRLMPMIVAHCPMDIGAAVMTTLVFTY